MSDKMIPDFPLVLEAQKLTAFGCDIGVAFRIVKQDLNLQKMFVTSNSWFIKQEMYPAISEGNVLYLRGSDRSKNDNVIVCTAKEFEAIKVAVAELNKEYTKVDVPKGSDKSFYVY